MTLLLLFVMAYEVTGDVLHEWFGIIALVLAIFHMVLNRKWFSTIFKGRYTGLRILTAVIDISVIASFLLCAFCGMSMSAHAVPFMYGLMPLSFTTRMHLAMSYWAFVFVGLHLGLHLRLLFIAVVSAGIYGLFLFATGPYPNYLTFRSHFAFLDYDIPKVLAILKNLSMMLAFVSIGVIFELSITARTVKKNDKA